MDPSFGPLPFDRFIRLFVPSRSIRYTRGDPCQSLWIPSECPPLYIPLVRGRTCDDWRIVEASHWWSWCTVARSCWTVRARISHAFRISISSIYVFVNFFFFLSSIVRFSFRGYATLLHVQLILAFCFVLFVFDTRIRYYRSIDRYTKFHKYHSQRGKIKIKGKDDEISLIRFFYITEQILIVDRSFSRFATVLL